MLQSKSKLAGLALAMGALLSVAPAYAGAYFARASGDVEIDGDSQPWTGYQEDGTSPFVNETSTSAAITNPGGTYNGSGGSATASADLATGQLKTYSTVSQAGYKTVGTWANSTASAAFGDSFTTTSEGSPFTWGANDAGVFTMSLDGTVTANFTNPSDANYYIAAANHLVWQVSLDIYQSGTFASNFNSGGEVGLCTWYGFLDGSTSTSCSSTELTNALSGDLTDGLTLTADINMGSDFDWWLTFNSISYMLAPGDLTGDLSHTLNVGYQGPAGATTVAASGIFPNLNATSGGDVPEPGTTGLLAISLLSLLALRRKSRSRG